MVIADTDADQDGYISEQELNDEYLNKFDNGK